MTEKQDDRAREKKERFASNVDRTEVLLLIGAYNSGQLAAQQHSIVSDKTSNNKKKKKQQQTVICA